jgi:hypothetical protein
VDFVHLLICWVMCMNAIDLKTIYNVRRLDSEHSSL